MLWIGIDFGQLEPDPAEQKLTTKRGGFCSYDVPLWWPRDKCIAILKQKICSFFSTSKI
jgi:hypothetical protein